MNSIYFDHAATTPMRREVIEAMVPVMEETFGNPSSVHAYGRKARKILDDARRTVSSFLNANEKDMIFTSGGTEADNLALIGGARANQHAGKHIITTSIEHHAILHAAEYLETEGFEVTYLPVNESGRISIDDFKRELREDTILVSVMYVNNETGVIQPIAEIGALLEEHQALFHTDAVQAFGTMPIDVSTLNIDMLTFSGHKINGPKGVGCLYAKEGLSLEARQHGGEQERKRRPGTENTAAVAGLAKAVELLEEEQRARLTQYKLFKKIFMDTLKENDVSFEVNGDRINLPTIVNVSFQGANVETLLTNFDLSGIAASSGSACTAGSIEPSHVLSAMFGEGNERTRNSIRFSFGLQNTEENVREGAEKVASIVKRVIKTT
ncbi:MULTISPECIES: cysteine desulfurase family protein [Pontibacillus]|uniref:cysteine desulfurase n=1 Tax=Pontibacillus chungwhensis TaxID=265426 RepID=A0ABY8UUS1_9BACI|nr:MULTISPECIES: cysteine desulfurase family protein [Pontibacillus]MCD5323678.1 cysteine desulfurase [Pontibacillus sp. HN14]WIF97043.1 cysteine desulfurase family protein [Pontibacillus chungwhensis]